MSADSPRLPSPADAFDGPARRPRPRQSGGPRLGPYRVLRELGSDSVGVVFLAEDANLHRRVALKVMRPEVAADPRARERFLREGRAAAALKSEHIVTIYEVGEADSAGGRVPFLAMEYLDGESLETRLRRDRILPPREVARIAREVATGLAAAHGAGLVHRDVKPANLWLEAPYDRLKILDFGLARPAEGGGDPLAGGTPAYLAPEQIRGEAVDARADLFSLGCVLYRCATGRPPFRGTTPAATLVALAADDPPPPDEVNPQVPAGLSALVRRLLVKDPAGRPESAHVVLQRLHEEAASERPSVLPPSPSEPAIDFTLDEEAVAAGTADTTPTPRRPAAARSPWLWPLPGLAGVLAAAGVALVWRSAVRPLELAGPANTAAVTAPRAREPAPRQPVDPAWLAMVADLSPADRAAAVREKLTALNPRSAGIPVFTTDTAGEVTGVSVSGTGLADLSPLRGLPGLVRLNAAHDPALDATTLRGLLLTELDVTGHPTIDLSELVWLPALVSLRCDPATAAAARDVLRAHPTLETVNGAPVRE
jgi:tRNA A-37 threonylcarbamoyl transferase component Bud32